MKNINEANIKNKNYLEEHFRSENKKIPKIKLTNEYNTEIIEIAKKEKASIWTIAILLLDLSINIYSLGGKFKVWQVWKHIKFAEGVLKLIKKLFI